MSHTGIPNRKGTRLMVIDLQGRLMPVIHEKERLKKSVNTLIKGMEILRVPTLVTEQYPKGIGHTDAGIELPENTKVFEKMCFSCMKDDHLLISEEIMGATDLVLCGVEAHVCVLQTALDAVEKGLRVHVVADAVSSRFEHNKILALERLCQSGVFIVSVEMILFQMMRESGNDEFRAISKLIK
ncbi:MAG: isochorismatase family protein [Saprospirales bacterium]|nr:MAG: isochorismatase family protein [Saprospirales bacterium]